MLLLPLLVYAAIGLLVGLGFVTRGVNRVDPAAAGSPFIFRLVILPGCIGLWPLILLKWARVEKGGDA